MNGCYYDVHKNLFSRSSLDQPNVISALLSKNMNYIFID